MELILINDTKLKIMLTREDMTRYDLDCESADYDNTETRRAFWSILDEAKHRTGFDAARDRVFIQLYPSREGGCEMFVTKVGLLSAGERRADAKDAGAGPAGTKGGSNRAPKSTGGESTRRQPAAAGKEPTPEELAFTFDSFDALVSCCRMLSAQCPSSAYAGDGGQWYLFVSPEDADERRELYCIMNEFGKASEAGWLRLYIAEHGKEIFGGAAVEHLAAL